MTPREIIDLFGGVRPMQKALDHSHPTTVAYWFKKNHIPKWRRSEIMKAARNKRLKLTAATMDAALGCS